MPQAALIQARLEIVGLPAGQFRFACDPIVSANPQFAQLVQTVAAGTFTTIAIPPFSSWLFVGFDPANAQAIRYAGGSTDQGVWIGPVGWASHAVVNQSTAGAIVLNNSGGGTDVTVQVVIV
jgi:hypothetical protein